MDMFHQVAQFLNQDMYHEFKIALSLGKWRSGEKLTDKQRKICEEVVSIKEAYSFQQPETTLIFNEKEHQQTSGDNPNKHNNITDFMVVDTIQ